MSLGKDWVGKLQWKSVLFRTTLIAFTSKSQSRQSVFYVDWWECWLGGLSTTLAHTKISQQLLDWLRWNFVLLWCPEDEPLWPRWCPDSPSIAAMRYEKWKTFSASIFNEPFCYKCTPLTGQQTFAYGPCLHSECSWFLKRSIKPSASGLTLTSVTSRHPTHSIKCSIHSLPNGGFA